MLKVDAALKARNRNPLKKMRPHGAEEPEPT